MNAIDRSVRAAVYGLFVDGHRNIDADLVSATIGVTETEVRLSLRRLAAEHRIALSDDGSVWMAHPFSGRDTGYSATIGERSWWANCAWDTLAILALIGDGIAHCPDGPTWTVRDGVVSPGGIVHLLVPARSFWEDIGFT